MTAKNKARGNTFDREIVELAQSMGLEAERAWLRIPGYDDFAISNMGEIMRVTKRGTSKPGRLIRLFVDRDGYMRTTIRNSDGEKRTVYPHRIVAELFIENPHGKPQVNHKNSLRHDNRSENLEWVTGAENIQHGINSGNINLIGSENPNARLTEAQVIQIRNMWPRESISRIAADFGIGTTTAGHIVHGRTWRHLL